MAKEKAKEARQLEREKRKARREVKQKAKEAEKKRKNGKDIKAKKKVEESKSKAKLEKSQRKKGKCDVNNEENASTKGEDDEDSAICPKCPLSIQMKVMCGCVATAMRHGMI